MESPPADQAALPPHATEETKRDETAKDDSVQVAVPVLECADAEEETNVAADTSLEMATESDAAETEIETGETALTEAISADGNLGKKPSHITAETAGNDIADSESKVVEEPQAIPLTVLELAPRASDTTPTTEPESPVHVLTPADTETETVEAISPEAAGEEGNLGEESITPYAETAGDDIAESESKVEEQQEATPTAMLQLSAADRDTAAIVEPESPVNVSTPAETETETAKAISTEPTSKEGNLGEKSGIPYAETPGDDVAESDTKVEEQPEDTPTTMLQLSATATGEPESSVHVLTPAVAETVFKSEEEDSNKDLKSGRAGVDAENPVQFIGETATDGAALAASDAIAGIEDSPQAPKDESASEIVEALESNSAQAQAASCVTSTADDDANETSNASDKVKQLASELATEPEVISNPDVSTPIDETSTDQDTKVVTESDSVDQEPIPDRSTENVPNDEAKLSESQEGAVEVPNKVEEKISEVEAVQEKNDDATPSDDTSSVAEVAVIPEVGEQTKRRTLQGLLTAEKNSEKVPTGDDQPTDSMSASNTMVPQDFDSNNSEEKAPDFPKENFATDNSDSVVAATETAKAVEVKDCSTITEDAVKEPVAEDAKSAPEDAKSIAESDLVPICNEGEKQGEAQKTDSTVAVKPSQRHSNNIMSKVKQSFVKVKKVIVGRSPSSKTLTPPTVEAGEIGIKSEQSVV